MLAVLAASSAFVQPATLNVARAASLTTMSEPTMGFFDNLQPKRSGAVGGSRQSTGPKQTPGAGKPSKPVERAEKSRCSRKISMRVWPGVWP